MANCPSRQRLCLLYFSVLFAWALSVAPAMASGKDQPKGPPPTPVRVAPVVKKMVSDQASLIGTTEAAATSTVAAEVSGIVEAFPVREGDFVKKGALLVRLRATELKLQLKGAQAGREKIRADLRLAEKELTRYRRLKKANSVAETRYDQAFTTHEALTQELIRIEADVDRLRYDLKRKQVVAPFSGFVAQEHTQVGEWINPGGAVVTLVDLSKIRVKVDVPERFVMGLAAGGRVMVLIRSLSDRLMDARIQAILPLGNPASRTIPVRVDLENPDYRVRGGMEAAVVFNLSSEREALLVPKDAVVLAGNDRMVYLVADNKAVPVMVSVEGYYDGEAAVTGRLEPGGLVVVRGNERLRPGQAVAVENEADTPKKEN
jgi:RND family efflux transporter MFP subunit